MVDTFRVVHPDPLEVPGTTWSPRGDRRENGQADPPERIDRLYLRNPLGRPALVPVRTTVYPLDPADAEAIALATPAARLPQREHPFSSIKPDEGGLKTLARAIRMASGAKVEQAEPDSPADPDEPAPAPGSAAADEPAARA